MADIFTLLKRDHDQHREILAELAEADADARQKLFEKFKAEALSHANAEEQTLYAEMMGDPDEQDEARHSVAEHKQIDEYVSTLEEMETTGEDWKATFLKLKHRYEHHIDEEEEEMFPHAKKHISDERAEELGGKFEERKPAEKKEVEAA
jgi:hemerythrin-like domain-containing protein|tara:strand:- start:63365 stop:63814 length:450 start_codon:yes stop_codon:yes gene_type:complete